MRIGIDARMAGPTVGGGGLGRYVEQFLTQLPRVDQHNRFVVFGKTKTFPDTATNFSFVATPIHWYTFAEQWRLGPLIDAHQLDLVHFPHWNVPIRMKTPFVVTIHDLILLDEPFSARATTLHPWIYAFKYAGFKQVLSHAVHASQKIITVSEASKHDLLLHFPRLNHEKIEVIYEGVTPLPVGAAIPPFPFPYLLHVGNSYPHKNLSLLIKAFALIHAQHPDLHLVLAGREDVFSQKIMREAHAQPIAPFVHFVSNPTDVKLATLYKYANLYVFPSKKEGFGLPALEAMSLGVPVVCSAIPSLKEITGHAAVYFSPDDPLDLANIVTHLLQHPAQRKELIAAGLARVAQFDWQTMTKHIVSVFHSCEHST